MKSITLKLPEGLHRWLADQARRSGRSKSELVREALERRQRVDKLPTGLDLAADLCGIGDSGLKDLSTNKKYLKGFGE